MHLEEYIFLHRKSFTIDELAEALEITRTHLISISGQRKKPSCKLAKKIEEITNGKVSRLEVLYPDEFHIKNFTEELKKGSSAILVLFSWNAFIGEVAF